MNHPSMTPRGKLIAGVLAVIFVGALPKHVDCDPHDMSCQMIDRQGRLCSAQADKPFVIYALDTVLHRDLPVAYSRAFDCK